MRLCQSELCCGPQNYGRKSVRCSEELIQIMGMLDTSDASYAEAFPAQLHNCEITDLDIDTLSWINAGKSSPGAFTLLIYLFLWGGGVFTHINLLMPDCIKYSLCENAAWEEVCIQKENLHLQNYTLTFFVNRLVHKLTDHFGCARIFSSFVSKNTNLLCIN